MGPGSGFNFISPGCENGWKRVKPGWKAVFYTFRKEERNRPITRLKPGGRREFQQ